MVQTTVLVAAGRHLTTGVLEGGGIALFELLAR